MDFENELGQENEAIAQPTTEELLLDAQQRITLLEAQLAHRGTPPFAYGCVMDIREGRDKPLESELKSKKLFCMIKNTATATHPGGLTTGLIIDCDYGTEDPLVEIMWDQVDGVRSVAFVSQLELLNWADGSYVTLALRNNIVEIAKPDNVEGLVKGCIVAVKMPSGMDPAMLINRVVDEPVRAGDIATVATLIADDASRVEVSTHGGQNKVIFTGRAGEMKVGDKVVLDESGFSVVENRGRDSTRWSFESSNVTWEDIGGLEEAKQTVVEAIEYPITHKELLAAYNKRPTKGILLYGPPGCGKTMVGKAISNMVQRLYGGAHNGFLYVKGPELLNMYVGQSEANIREIFSVAREFKEEHGYPATVFIDEADAVLGKRDGNYHVGGMERTIVPMFLAEMDGMGESSAIVILATNLASALDSAVTRDGRIDRKIQVKRPDPVQAYKIFNIHLARAKLSESTSIEALAKAGIELMYSKEEIVFYIQTKDKGEIPVTVGQCSSGAMIANVVDHASSLAIRRDIKNNRIDGVQLMDIAVAIGSIKTQMKDLDKNTLLREFREIHPNVELVGVRTPARV